MPTSRSSKITVIVKNALLYYQPYTRNIGITCLCSQATTAQILLLVFLLEKNFNTFTGA